MAATGAVKLRGARQPVALRRLHDVAHKLRATEPGGVSADTQQKHETPVLTCLWRCGVELELWLVALKAADVFVELLPKRAQLRNERLAQHVLRDVRAASAHAVSSRAAARASAVRGARLMKVIVMISSHNANVSAMKIQL